MGNKLMNDLAGVRTDQANDVITPCNCEQLPYMNVTAGTNARICSGSEAVSVEEANT